MNIDACYKFKKNIYNDGLFNSSVDATYVLNLEGNGRLSSVEEQLSIYHPTNVVYIVSDKGYKKCKKGFCEKHEIFGWL